MERIESPEHVENLLRELLEAIQEREAGDSSEVDTAMRNMRSRGGIKLGVTDLFEIGREKMGVYIRSEPGNTDLSLGEKQVSLNEEIYVIGRDPEKGMVYYSKRGDTIGKKLGGMTGVPRMKHFDTAIVPSAGQVNVFNLVDENLVVHFEGEIEF